jgi:hypothetical protein
MTLPIGRAGMPIVGNLLNAHASQFGYTESSARSQIFDFTYDELVAWLASGKTVYGDCSSTYEACRKMCGCVNLPPLGWTGTELETMPHITLAEADVGDAIVFGYPPGKHVVWVTSPHPTNPSVNSGHLDPKIDSHGMPGFQETDFESMWNAAFAGQPYTVLSLAPFLPKPTPSYHYERFTAGLERNAVMEYDRLTHSADRQKLMWSINMQRAILRARRLTIVAAAHSPNPKKPNWTFRDRGWRNQQILLRVNGDTVGPS